MPTVTQIIKFRNQRRIREQCIPGMRLSLGFSIILSLLGVIGSLAGVWFYTNLTQDLPSIDILQALLEPPDGVLLQPTRLYDRTHEHLILTLENPTAVDRKYLHVGVDGQQDKDQFSQTLIDATIAAYDPGNIPDTQYRDGRMAHTRHWRSDWCLMWSSKMNRLH